MILIVPPIAVTVDQIREGVNSDGSMFRGAIGLQ
jgi:hypothetical protein